MFISPLRSELNAIDRPSGDHAPRLSSRLVAMVSRGAPVGRPLDGSTGSVQMLAFWRRIEKARRAPSGEGAGSRSWPAPGRDLLRSTPRLAARGHGDPPEVQAAAAVRREVDEAPGRRPDGLEVLERVVRDPLQLLRREVDDAHVELRALPVLEDDAAAVRRPAGPHVDDRLGDVARHLLGDCAPTGRPSRSAAARPRERRTRSASPFGREGRVVGVVDELQLAAGRAVDRPDVAFALLAEQDVGLELAPGPAGPDEQDRRAVGRPARLDVVERARRDRRLAASRRASDEDLPHAADVGGVDELVAGRRERGGLLESPRDRERARRGAPDGPGARSARPRARREKVRASRMRESASRASRSRRSGSFSRQARSRRRTAAGVPGGSRFQSGSSWRIAARQSETVSPANAWRPVSIS